MLGLRTHFTMKLEKYYFDGMTEDNEIFICYHAFLTCAFFKIPYISSIYKIGDVSSENHHFSKGNLKSDTNKIDIELDKFAISGQWELGGAKAFSELYKDKNHYIQWRLISGGSPAKIIVNGKTFHMLGYCERIDINMPLLKLPIKRLLWGRWIGKNSKRCVTWIIWDGKIRINKIWDNSLEFVVEKYEDDKIFFNDKVLEIKRLGDIRQGNVDDSLLKSNFIKKLLPSSFKNIMEKKYYGEAMLDGENGKVIYEEVVWK